MRSKALSDVKFEARSRARQGAPTPPAFAGLGRRALVRPCEAANGELRCSVAARLCRPSSEQFTVALYQRLSLDKKKVACRTHFGLFSTCGERGRRSHV